MNILGVCNANVSGASLLIDGAVVASVNEERFTRVKNDRAFPEISIRYCLDHAGLKTSDVDWVACGAWGGVEESYLARCVGELLEAVEADPDAHKHELQQPRGAHRVFARGRDQEPPDRERRLRGHGQHVGETSGVILPRFSSRSRGDFRFG